MGQKQEVEEKEFGAERCFSALIHSTVGERCPVKLHVFKIFLAHRPPDRMKPEDPLYLATMKNPIGQVWYKRQPLNVHSLGQFMKTMAEAVNLSGT